MIKVSCLKITLHRWQFICQLMVIRFNGYQPTQIHIFARTFSELGFLRRLGRRCKFGLRMLMRSSWFIWIDYMYLRTTVFLLKLLVTHLDEHVVIDFMWPSSIHLSLLINFVLWFILFLFFLQQRLVRRHL
jgi:hypothetical protein